MDRGTNRYCTRAAPLMSSIPRALLSPVRHGNSTAFRTAVGGSAEVVVADGAEAVTETGLSLPAAADGEDQSRQWKESGEKSEQGVREEEKMHALLPAFGRGVKGTE